MSFPLLPSGCWEDQGLNKQRSGMGHSKGKARNTQVIWQSINFLLGFSQSCSSSREYLPVDRSVPPTSITKGSLFLLLCYLPAGSLSQASFIFKKGYNFSNSPYEIKCGVTYVVSRLRHCETQFVSCVQVCL